MASPEEIRHLRKQLRESQTAFGKRFGVNQATISRWETFGVPNRGALQLAVAHVMQRIKKPRARTSSASRNAGAAP